MPGDQDAGPGLFWLQALPGKEFDQNTAKQYLAAALPDLYGVILLYQ